MSEDKTQAVTETVSESPATETTQDSSSEQYIAESKKYRKRAQDAETRLVEFEKKFATAEEDKLKKKEEYKTLYEKASSEIEALTSNANKWSKYEETKRASLLDNHPEEDRERLSKLDLDTLEYISNKINKTKANVPEVVGKARGVVIDKPIDWANKDWLKENWSQVTQSYKQKK